MRADDVTDPARLKTWLEARPASSREIDGILIAQRAILRLLPLTAQVMGAEWAQHRTLLGFSSLRRVMELGCLRDGIAERPVSVEIARAAYAGQATARAISYYAIEFKASGSAVVSAARAEIGYDDELQVNFLQSETYVIATVMAVFRVRPKVWAEIEQDIEALNSGKLLASLPLWHNSVPDWFNEALSETHAIWDADPPGTWDFWKRWYRGILDGRPMDPALERDIALIPDEDWEKGPVHIAGLIAAIEKLHHPTTLSRAALADFEFVDVLRHMKMVGFADDLAHLRDPRVVQAFLDDMAEVSDGLQDVLDYSAEARTRGNSCAMACVAIEKVLRELSLAKDSTHLRARRLIQLAGDVQMFSQSPDAQMAFGSIADKLDDRLSTLRGICRKHFGPSLMRLAVLKDLALGQLDPGEMLVALRHVVDRIVARDGRDFPRLAPEAVAVLRDMLDELDSTRTAIAEAQTPEHRETLRKRFAESFGGTTATVGRYVEKAAPHAAKATERVDGAIRAYKRWENLTDMVDWLRDLFF